jgi:hypothetical protein
MVPCFLERWSPVFLRDSSLFSWEMVPCFLLMIYDTIKLGFIFPSEEHAHTMFNLLFLQFAWVICNFRISQTSALIFQLIIILIIWDLSLVCFRVSLGLSLSWLSCICICVSFIRGYMVLEKLKVHELENADKKMLLDLWKSLNCLWGKIFFKIGLQFACDNVCGKIFSDRHPKKFHQIYFTSVWFALIDSL